MIDAADHIGLVRHLYARHRSRFPRSMDPEDIQQAGMLGLVKAVARYRPLPGGSFPALARTYILGEMYAEVRCWMGCRGVEHRPPWTGEPWPRDHELVLCPDWQRFVAPGLDLLDLGLLLARLRPQERFLVEEIALAGYGVGEVAERMGLSMTVVSKRYRYAVGKMQDFARGGRRTYRLRSGHRAPRAA